MTQMGVGNDCETHYNYIGEIERGIREPTVFKIADIAIGLGVEPSEIFVLADQLLAEDGSPAVSTDRPADESDGAAEPVAAPPAEQAAATDDESEPADVPGDDDA